MKLPRIIITIALIFSSNAFAKEVLVGVVEQAQDCQKQGKFSARIMFVKQGTEWNALGADLPSTKWNIDNINWEVAFDGKSLGHLSIKEPSTSVKYINDWYYHRDKKQALVENQKFPKIRNKPGAFAGWCSGPEYRPLVLVSENHYKDPQGWKPFTAGPEYQDKLYPFLKVVVGRLNSIVCRPNEDVLSVPYIYRPRDTVIYKSYKSSSGQVLISIGLNVKDFSCELIMPPEWSNNWFLISGNDIDYLGRQMELVDAGDSDGDGKSELLFWHSGYNNDGYVLVYNNFHQKAEYLWGYH